MESLRNMQEPICEAFRNNQRRSKLFFTRSLLNTPAELQVLNCGSNNNWIIGGVEKGVDIVKCKLQWERYIEAIAPYCGKCWAYPLCHGPCIWECAREDGTIVFNNNYCDFMKKSIERSAYLSLHQQNSLDDNKLAIDQHIDRC